MFDNLNYFLTLWLSGYSFNTTLEINLKHIYIQLKKTNLLISDASSYTHFNHIGHNSTHTINIVHKSIGASYKCLPDRLETILLKIFFQNCNSYSKYLSIFFSSCFFHIIWYDMLNGVTKFGEKKNRQSIRPLYWLSTSESKLIKEMDEIQ